MILAREMPEFLHNNWPKNIFPDFWGEWGGGHVSPALPRLLRLCPHRRLCPWPPLGPRSQTPIVANHFWCHVVCIALPFKQVVQPWFICSKHYSSLMPNTHRRRRRDSTVLCSVLMTPKLVKQNSSVECYLLETVAREQPFIGSREQEIF